jgi:hypothetical protein
LTDRDKKGEASKEETRYLENTPENINLKLYYKYMPENRKYKECSSQIRKKII